MPVSSCHKEFKSARICLIYPTHLICNSKAFSSILSYSDKKLNLSWTLAPIWPVALMHSDLLSCFHKQLELSSTLALIWSEISSCSHKESELSSTFEILMRSHPLSCSHKGFELSSTIAPIWFVALCVLIYSHAPIEAWTLANSRSCLHLLSFLTKGLNFGRQPLCSPVCSRALSKSLKSRHFSSTFAFFTFYSRCGGSIVFPFKQ